MIRLTGGVAGGRPVPKAISAGIRPTSSRVREALFSILGQDLCGQRFLDAFGGAGLMGLDDVYELEQKYGVTEVPIA